MQAIDSAPSGEIAKTSVLSGLNENLNISVMVHDIAKVTIAPKQEVDVILSESFVKTKLFKAASSSGEIDDYFILSKKVTAFQKKPKVKKEK